MTEQRYRKIEIFFRSHERLYFLLRIIYKYLPYPFFVAYPALLAFLLWTGLRQGDLRSFIRVFVTPAVVFVTVTLFRRFADKPRPYEALKITPLIKKDKRGQSFPSRHAASVFVIATAFLSVNLWLGIAMLFLGAVMCLSRVLAGVHFVSDVIAGAVFALACGWFGMFFI